MRGGFPVLRPKLYGLTHARLRRDGTPRLLVNLRVYPAPRRGGRQDGTGWAEAFLSAAANGLGCGMDVAARSSYPRGHDYAQSKGYWGDDFRPQKGVGLLLARSTHYQDRRTGNITRAFTCRKDLLSIRDRDMTEAFAILTLPVFSVPVLQIHVTSCGRRLVISVVAPAERRN